MISRPLRHIYDLFIDTAEVLGGTLEVGRAPKEVEAEIAGSRIGLDTAKVHSFAEGNTWLVGLREVIELMGGVEAGIVGFGFRGEDGGKVEAEAIEILRDLFEVGVYDVVECRVKRLCAGHLGWLRGLHQVDYAEKTTGEGSFIYVYPWTAQT